ncbi:MAG: LacI family transcriptional regulator [Ignavibacteria bacterium]
MGKRPTIRDVAQKAGLSLSTVSLVINDSGYVSPETREKVLQAIDELGYHPSRAARGLASKTSGNIGFILSEDHFSLAEPFYTKIFLGTEFEARNHNYYILLTTVGSRFREPDNVPRFLLERNVDGVIIAGRVNEKLIAYIDRLGLPILLVDYAVPKKHYSSIQMDNRKGAHLAVEHLISLGHREIGFLGGDISHPSIAERYQAYKECMTDHNLTLDSRLIVTEESGTAVENGSNALRTILNRGVRPSAVFAANDAMAIGCIQEAKVHGWKIPDDISVVGFDDIDTSAHIEPPLTTIKVFKEEMGAAAVRTLVQAVKAETRSVMTVHMPVELVVRKSTTRYSGNAAATTRASVG